MGDASYFASYGDLATHELMLKDAPRMAAYAAAVDANASFIRGRAVLDVGAGTGILSLLCARAGARAVYAVEASPMAEHLRDIVERNGYAGVITVFESAMEETTLPEQVDVVISEWMGFHLLHEACALRSCAPALYCVADSRRRVCSTACCWRGASGCARGESCFRAKRGSSPRPCLWTPSAKTSSDSSRASWALT
jgi:SAM-dependent methyltransferase